MDTQALGGVRLHWPAGQGATPAWLVGSLSAPVAPAAPPAPAATVAQAPGAAPAVADPGGATALSVQLLLLPTLPTPGLCWLLTDGSGVPLDATCPLLHGVTAGHGIDLALWQRHKPDTPWAPLRRLHVGSPARYVQALRALPSAVARLLQQAAVDLQEQHKAGGGTLQPPAPAAQQGAAKGAQPTRSTSAVHVPAQPSLQPPPASLARRLAQRLRGVWVQERTQWRRRWLSEAWQIGVVERPLHTWVLDGTMPAVRWLPSPPGDGYWADPMADGVHPDQLLCEYFDDSTGRGRIERLALQGGAVHTRQVLPLGHGQHASFPLVQTIGGRRVGVLETAALGQCQLHTVADDGSWRPLATVLDGVAAADPALFEWEGRFWLAYTDIALGAFDNLCLLHAPALEGPWQPHANNPVKVDVTGARMAGGLFWHQGALYRPAQNCLQTYGASVVLHRVLRCSPTTFMEETVRELRPDPHGPCPDGMHTLSAWGTRTLVDGKRHVFSARSVWWKLQRRWQQPRPPAGKAPAVDLP